MGVIAASCAHGERGNHEGLGGGGATHLVAWEAHVAADREIEMALWHDAHAKDERVEEDAKWMALNAKGSM